MKRLLFATLALATAGALYAKVDPEMAEKVRRAKERFAAMSPKEQEEYRWKKAMKRFGGWLTKEGSGKGQIAFVDTTSKLPAGWLEKAIYEIEDLVQCRMVAQTSTNAVTLANASKELLRSHSAAAVFLVDDPALPSLLVAPESDWAFINLAALSEGNPDEKKFLFRVEKEIWRTFGYLCGAADGIAAIAANNGIDCDELTKASNGLKASISTMHDNISAIYESYSTLSGALSEFLLRLPEDQLSARELEGLEQYRQTVDGTASVIDEAGYNESVRSFRSTLLFPADVFMFVCGVDYPEYFS